MQSLPQIAPEQYDILSLLGSGGMSSVYLARQRDMDRLVAIKSLHKHLTFDAKALQRFKNEAAWTGRLNHPNVVSVYAFGISEDQPFLAMEYVKGRTLKAIISSDGALTPDRVRSIALQLLEGLQHAHEQGIVHRDLKPENIMIVELDDGTEQVKILDFGVAKVIEECRPQSQKLTGTGALIGSPLYMSPEQLKGQPADVRTDIYSIGCILFEALVGRPPFKTDNMLELMQSHLATPVPSFSSIVPKHTIPGEMERAVRKALEKNPNSRYADASSFASELAQRKVGKPLRDLVSIKTTMKLVLACLLVLLSGIVFFCSTKNTGKPGAVKPVAARKYNDGELQRYIDNEPVWRAKLDQLSAAEQVAFLDECVDYARAIKVSPGSDLQRVRKALTLAQALQNRALQNQGRHRLLLIDNLQRAHTAEVRAQLSQYSQSSKSDTTEALKVLRDAKIAPTNKHHLHLLPGMLAEALEHEGLFEQAREVRQQAFVVYPKIGCLDNDYFWLYSAVEKNACAREDRKEEYEFALKAMDRLQGCTSIDYEQFSLGLPTAVEHAVVALMQERVNSLEKAIVQVESRLKKLREKAVREDWLKAIDKQTRELQGPLLRASILTHAGRDAFRSRNWQSAEKFYLAAVPYFQILDDKTPRSYQQQVDAWYHLGLAFAAQRKIEKSTEALKKAIELAPFGMRGQNIYTRAYTCLADEQWRVGNYDEAFRLLDEGLAGSKVFDEARAQQYVRVSLVGHKGNLLQMSGQFRRLVDELSAFQASVPSEYHHHKLAIELQIVNACLALGELHEADKHLTKAKELSSKVTHDPNATDAVIQMLQVCDQLASIGRHEQAANLALWARDFARERKLGGAEFFALAAAAKYIQPVDRKRASEFARTAYQLAERNKKTLKSGVLAANAFFVVGGCFLQEPAIAEACFKRGIAAQDLSGAECDFHVANNYVALGNLYSRQNKNKLAEQCMEKALDLHQHNYRVNRNASWVLVSFANHCERNNETAKAIKLEEELLHELETPDVPENQKDFAYIACVDLARLYGQQGNEAKARQYTNRSLRYQH